MVEALGAGGMGVVYRARHATTGEVVAVKTVQAQGEAVLAGIRREIHALRSLDHPGVVHIVDDGLEHGVPWYAMELLDGPTLRRFHRERSSASLRNDPPSDPGSLGSATTARGPGPRSATGQPVTPRAGAAPTALPMLRESLTALRAVCSTLAFVHGRGVIHRDLKPDNVILTADRGPVIVDLGIASRGLGSHGREVLHATGRAVGSPGYMAPEQILGEIVDARTDLYAIGVMLFEAITGRLPFDGESTQLVLSRKLYEDAPTARTWAPEIPDALDRLVNRLLARRPQDRIGHADDVAAVLAALGADPPSVKGPPAEPYLYRPGLAGRGDALEAIEGILGAASVARVFVPGDAPVEAPSPSSYRRPVEGTLGATAGGLTMGGATLDVTSGRDLASPRKGGFVLVGGESGVGKTRLALELTTRAAQRGFRVVTGQCERLGAGDEVALRAAPLHPLRDLFHAIADRCRSLGPGAYDLVLGPRGPVLAPFEPLLAELDGYAAHPTPAELPPEAARTRLHEALSETLRAFAASEPLLLVLDDLQWADEHTLQFLAWLDQAWFRDTPVVVLATFRVEEETPEITALLRRPGAHVERLARLDERAVARIVRDMLAVDLPDDRLVGFLHRHTEGNPFFVAEYLRTAIERGLLLRDEGGRWCFDARAAGGELERLPLPSTLRELVALRLAGLGAEELAIARTLAVLGREVDASVLARALDDGGSLPTAAMVQLVRRQVVDEPEPGVVRFVHDKLREVVYASLGPAERARVHGRAASALASHAEARGELERVALELAHHHAEAGEVERALGFLDQAAEGAMRTGAVADALRALQRAAALYDGAADERLRRALAGRRVRWERRAAEAQHALGDLRAAELCGRSALRLAVGASTLLDRKIDGTLADRARFAGEAAWAVGRQLAGLALGPRAGTDDRAERWREAALAAEKLAQTYLFLNDATPAALASVLATNFAGRLGASPELARGHAQLGIAAAYVPSERLARAYFARADEIARHLDDPETDCSVDFMCGYWSMGAGDFATSHQRLGAALDRARALCDRRREEEALALLAMGATFQGRLDDALARYGELDSLSRRTRNAQAAVWGRSGRATVWAFLGRIDESLAMFDDVMGLIESTDDQSERILIGQTAPLHLARGDRARARAIAEEALRLFEAAPPAGSQLLHGVEGLGDALLALWTQAPPGPERRSLEPLAARGVGAAASFARYFPIGRPIALRLEAAWSIAQGDVRRPAGLLRRAVADGRRLGLPVAEARARIALAGQVTGAARRAELEVARELLGRCRAGLYLPELEAAS